MSAVVLALTLVSVTPAVAGAAEWKVNGSPVTTSTAVTWKGHFAMFLQGVGAHAEVRCEESGTGTIGAKGANETKLSFSNCVDWEDCPKPTLTVSETWKASLLTVSGSVMDGMRAEGESGHFDEVTIKCEGSLIPTPVTCTVSNPTMTNSSPNVLATWAFKAGEGSKNCGSSPNESYYTGAQTIALTKGGVLQVSP